jgi:hypothetical protein
MNIKNASFGENMFLSSCEDGLCVHIDNAIYLFYFFYFEGIICIYVVKILYIIEGQFIPTTMMIIEIMGHTLAELSTLR